MLNARIGQFAKRQMTSIRGMERRCVPIRGIAQNDEDAVFGAVPSWTTCRGWRRRRRRTIFLIRGEITMVKSPQERQTGGVAVKPAELQMRFHDILSRSAVDRRAHEFRKEDFGPFLTISRQAESGGAEVARAVGSRLGWSVLDKELVEDLAERLKLAPQLLALMDETKSDWFRDTMLNLLNSRLVLQDSYVAMLGRVILLAAFDGRVVIVGRGAHLMLPRQHGLRVRVVAPIEVRVARLQERERLDAASAENRIERIDRSRAEFLRRHFHTGSDESQLFDLILDAATFGIQGTADMICRALELRGLVQPGAHAASSPAAVPTV
jgi:hypothetical protein